MASRSVATTSNCQRSSMRLRLVESWLASWRHAISQNDVGNDGLRTEEEWNGLKEGEWLEVERKEEFAALGRRWAQSRRRRAFPCWTVRGHPDHHLTDKDMMAAGYDSDWRLRCYAQVDHVEVGQH